MKVIFIKQKKQKRNYSFNNKIINAQALNECTSLCISSENINFGQVEGVIITS